VTVSCSLDNRVALVTGANTGLGQAAAIALAAAGADIAAVGRTDPAETAERVRALGRRLHYVAADLAVSDNASAAVAAAVSALGGVDILVNNAGTMYSGRFAVIDDDEMKKQLDTKLFGFMRAIRLVYPMMKAQKWGRIVNTIGGAGKEPDPYMFGSGMTNAALLNLTKSLSTEFGEDNVLVNAICPGWVDTNLWRKNAEGLRQELGAKSEDEARRAAARKNSVNRFGKPEELANATVFLCSERASHITGVSLNLDGGRLKGLW
jgi:3-oxoacyl-[acyl-carrier protein] reductase